ncbi:unnamed protein product [Mytilus edulis]|uniref:Transmembrane protein 179 n=1 Tax=Mytilus edulis TaxID=6550 RepID=A0A8S3TNR9_MYTED|nr:unnamed protein product [Mytilus edulis]
MGKFARKVQEKSDKYIPIVLHSLTIIFCMCTFIPIGSVKNYFHGECVLYAQPVLTAVTRPNNLTTITVDLVSSVWGELSTCYYVIYTPVVVGIYTFIWLWFHIQLRMSIFDEGNVLAAFIIGGVTNIILFITLFVTSCIVVVGTSQFCSNIETALNHRYDCSEVEDLVWSVYTDGRTHSFYRYLQLGQAGSWITLAILAVHIVFHFKKGMQLLPSRNDNSNETESIISDDECDATYQNHDINDETGSVRFHHTSSKNKSFKRSDESFLLPL